MDRGRPGNEASFCSDRSRQDLGAEITTHSVISNINLSACRLLLLSVVRPSLECGSEVWEGNKNQAAALESVLLCGGMRLFKDMQCSKIDLIMIYR